MRIIIKTDEPELKANERTIQYILMDALAEFQSHRGPTPEAYVNKRYPDSQVYSGKEREKKIQQVGHRIRLAEILRNAAAHITIEWE
jgi:hypothetical protein